MLLWLAASCAEGSRADPGARIACRIDPSPPAVGPATVELELTDSGGRPLAAAQVDVEGNMNHAGMVPELATAAEVSPGRYRASIEFTMAGDWFLLVEAKLADGRRVEETIQVPNVRRP